MTSEIVIMTPNAIAMAADSAVTIDNRKIYNGINKLFMLSNNPPMGVMIYNNTSFLNIPFETIIKEYRKSIQDSLKRDNNKFSTICDFQKRFEEYFKVLLEKSEFKFSFDFRIKIFLQDLSNFIQNNPNFNENIVNFRISDKKLFDAIYNKIDEEYLNRLKEIAINIEKNLKFPHDKDIFINNFINYIIEEIFSKNFTGIVLAGFDKDCFFPSCTSFKVCYLYDDEYILCDFQHDTLSPEDGDVRINMFAQHDAILTFLNGINPNTKVKILNFFNEEHNSYLQEIINIIENNGNIDNTIKQNMINDIISYDGSKNVYGRFEECIKQIETEEYLPMLQSIGALPYVELSNLCESLIKITSLKRKVGSDLETVGGDVDVAIITKGDGFIWTKRKHYFDSKLNYQFFETK